MIVLLAASYIDAIEKITDTSVIRKADNAFEKLKVANSLDDVANVIKPMHGYPGLYRLRFGDFRIGFRLIDKNTIKLVYIKHRSKFYRYFPANFVG